MKKKILIALSYVLVIALTLAATVAYFTDTDSAVNVMTVGNIAIEQIEQERDESGKLVAFTQSKLLMPSHFEGSSINWAPAEEWVVANDQAWKVVADNSNVIDKFVTVKNTGDNDAFVRTIIAYEGNLEYGPEGAYIHVVHNGDNVDPAIKIDCIGVANIDGVDYTVYVYTYPKALASGDTSDPSLKQIYMNKNTTQEIAAKYGKTYDVLVLSQAVQADMNGAGAVEALNAAFGEINATKAAELFAPIAPEDVGDDAGFEDAATTDKEEIVINLTSDVTYDVAAWSAEAMGGKATKSITINGNGYTLTFNQTDSDWNNIVTNGATLKLNNLKLTNSGHNNGPWNRHDLNFACNVEMNNVVTDKAMAFKAGAVLKNVTVSDANTSDTYAIWIQPNGQTVTLDGCTIDMLDCTDGRGIKIDEQYVSAPQLVTLNVKDTTFKTEEKSAILVKSVAGANINLDNVNIYGVAADPINEVWVDEASAAYADLVTVTGGDVVVEGEYKIATVSNNADLDAAIKDGVDAVVLTEGVYIIPDSAQRKTLTIVGAGDTVIATQDDGSYEGCDYSLDGATVTFENVTINTDSRTYTGYARCKGTYNNCTINGTFTLYDNSVFNDCTFNVSGDIYNIWTWGASNATFDKCIFNCSGKAILLYGGANTALTAKDCVFNDANDYDDVNNKAAIEVGSDWATDTKSITATNCTVNGFDVTSKGLNTGSTLWGNKNSLPTNRLNVVINGVDVY